MRYLLDTNIISNVINQPRGAASVSLREKAGAGTIVTSIIVAAEIRFGYTKIKSRRLQDAYEQFFKSLTVEKWEAPFDHAYANIRSDLERLGQPIGAMDMLIAAHAVATDAVVVTGNVKHFSLVPNLKVENWLS
ncbi:MAG: type II toxin-antitoxin system VapC family toxin [Allorhizobium sp.]